MKHLILFCFILLATTACTQKKLPKPNVLWLTFEDSSPQYIGCYGNKGAKTPVMDQLASEGARFTSAFSTGTVCSPSRYALITATSPTMYGTGHHRSAHSLPDFVEAFPTYLRDAGYYTSNNSKTDYNTAKAKHFIKTAWDESSNNAGWWKREAGQPFFAVFNCAHSHQSRTMTNPWWKYDEQVLAHLTSDEIIKDNEFEMPPFFHDSPEMRKEHSRVYNGIQLTDKFFGEILQRLETEGLRDSTIIFCYSDHGEGITGGKTHARGMGYRVPLIIWIPEIYKDLSPWGSGGVVIDDIVNFTDLSATVLALAGVTIPDYIEGLPLMGENRVPSRKYSYGGLDRTGENVTLSRSITDGTYIYNRHFMPFQPEMRWQKYFDYSHLNDLIRNDHKDGKLNKVQSAILDQIVPETFFNLEKDGWETDNLTADKTVSKQMSIMAQELKRDLITKRDAHFIPEYSHNRSGITPYDLSRDDKLFPAERVIETAFKIGREDKLEELLAAATDSNKIVRYWASVGIFSHCSLYGYDQSMDQIKDDNYPPADIFIQGVKAFYLDDKLAQNKLLSYLGSKSKDLTVLAAQLFLLQDKLDPEIHKQFLDITYASKDEEIHQCGELLEYKADDKPLLYEHFW